MIVFLPVSAYSITVGELDVFFHNCVMLIELQKSKLSLKTSMRSAVLGESGDSSLSYDLMALAVQFVYSKSELPRKLPSSSRV